MSMAIDEYCLCGLESEDGCECQYQVVKQAPEGWKAFIRQKPYILFDPSEEEVIYVIEKELFGKIPIGDVNPNELTD